MALSSTPYLGISKLHNQLKLPIPSCRHDVDPIRRPPLWSIRRDIPDRPRLSLAPALNNVAATMPSEREMQINPIVQESVIHNTKTLSNLHSLAASLFGVSAGILGLESYSGFLGYILFSILTTFLLYLVHIAPASLAEGRTFLSTGRYYRGVFDFWTSGLFNGLSGFVLTWTLFYGLVRA
ncbi:Rab5-interacting protein-domain-containing protein [Stachybotrys elegans]|uniref:ER membrane protein complex subunit 6 n=1 Tax=Stachybotrys elegans TaxID=80388 RepID=A0A8K0T5C2_9HYPO|nr:Rab5-interacting protein-domain-containing protein [Stachybotrys elegans]